MRLRFLFFVLLLIPGYLLAQTCSGNFGEPVVNLNFGSGSNPGPSQSTNYNYVSSDCPNDGSYTIIRSTSNCFSSWHTLTEDHTPNDVGGYMMLVNASNSPGEFYKQTISDLCPGTTYEFAAWVVNMVKLSNAGIKPNLTFTIEAPDGTILGTYSTGNILESSSPEWKKYGLIFTTSSSISQVILKIVNNAPGGNGNDIALDDITFRACGPSILPTANADQAAPIVCEGQSFSVSLDATISSGFSDPAYQWQIKEGDLEWQDVPGANLQASEVTVQNASSDGYQFRLTAAESFNINSVKCRIVSDPIEISVSPAPTVDAGPDLSTMQNRPVQLTASAEGNNLRYLWSPSTYLDDPTLLNPVSTPMEDITYTLQVSDDCTTVSDEVFVKVYEEINVPNAFSPNGDGVNDLWNVAGLISYPEATVKVYNRYGNIIFLSYGYTSPWTGLYKGQPVPQGLYFYVIDLQTSVVAGSVTVLR